MPLLHYRAQHRESCNSPASCPTPARTPNPHPPQTGNPVIFIAVESPLATPSCRHSPAPQQQPRHSSAQASNIGMSRENPAPNRQRPRPTAASRIQPRPTSPSHDRTPPSAHTRVPPRTSASVRAQRRPAANVPAHPPTAPSHRVHPRTSHPSASSREHSRPSVYTRVPPRTYAPSRERTRPAANIRGRARPSANIAPEPATPTPTPTEPTAPDPTEPVPSARSPACAPRLHLVGCLNAIPQLTYCSRPVVYLTGKFGFRKIPATWRDAAAAASARRSDAKTIAQSIPDCAGALCFRARSPHPPHYPPRPTPP